MRVAQLCIIHPYCESCHQTFVLARMMLRVEPSYDPLEISEDSHMLVLIMVKASKKLQPWKQAQHCNRDLRDRSKLELTPLVVIMFIKPLAMEVCVDHGAFLIRLKSGLGGGECSHPESSRIMRYKALKPCAKSFDKCSCNEYYFAGFWSHLQGYRFGMKFLDIMEDWMLQHCCGSRHVWESWRSWC